jgi:inner membrane protein
LLLVVASNFPDVDLVLGFLGPEVYILWHRGLTHALAGLLIFPPALAYLAHAVAPSLSFRRALLLAEVGTVFHILLDIPTAWGTLALYPWSHARLALNWVFIIDPVLWALPLGGVLLSLRRKSGGRRVAAASLALCAVYILFVGAIHGWARERAREQVTSSPAAVAGRAGALGDIDVYPQPLAPWRWLAVAWRRDSLEVVSLQGLPPRVTGSRSEPHGLGDPQIEAALMTQPGQAFLWWAGAPACRLVSNESAQTIVHFSDLRFALRRADPFEMEIVLDERGDYVEATWVGEVVFKR